MENPENEDIIIPVCTLLIAAGIQQYKGNDCGLDIRLPGETNISTRIIIGGPKWSQELFKDGYGYLQWTTWIGHTNN